MRRRVGRAMTWTVPALVAGALAQGCAALADAAQGPRLYGGTRLLLDDPLPIHPEVPEADGRVLAGALWLLDLPLSLAIDTALAPWAAVWALIGPEAPPPGVEQEALALELTLSRG